MTVNNDKSHLIIHFSHKQILQIIWRVPIHIFEVTF